MGTKLSLRKHDHDIIHGLDYIYVSILKYEFFKHILLRGSALFSPLLRLHTYSWQCLF